MTPPRERAVLVGIQLPGVDAVDHQASLAELGRLVHTLGYEVVGEVSQRRDGLAPGVVLGEGKLRELAGWTAGSGEVEKGPRRVVNKARAKWEFADGDEEEAAPVGEDESEEEDEDEDELAVDDDAAARASRRADLVVVDHDISPSQARHLQMATGVPVLDRTGVIVEIFHRHAQSREARLQVEIARLVYLVPRMRASGGAERQRGGIGGKGAGESALELDRRKVRDRIAQLREELESIESERGTRRARRADQLRVALVGYTNAGKSSLMRALTGSDVYVADKLFATLDTTVRSLHPENVPRVLVSDTVGFIKKLPHDLVASFRSTLDEALEASLLLHVVDASDPTFRAQYEVTRAVLAEIGADEVPSRLVLNKIDRVDDATRAALVEEYPNAIVLSAHDPADIVRMRDFIVAWFERDMAEIELFVPWARGAVVGEIHAHVRVITESYEDEGTRFLVRGRKEDVARLVGMLA
ncbi:MAG: GTPase HflX [Pseudomonadota bacterium]|nr:GTPase HflX [Pseudomonadota bacterium]